MEFQKALDEIQGDIYPDLYWTSGCKRPAGSSGTPFATGMCGNVALTLGHLSTYPANKNCCEHDNLLTSLMALFMNSSSDLFGNEGR